MKIRSLFYGILCMLAIGGTMASCSDDDDEGWDDTGSKVELPRQRAYILNEGKMNANNAGIAFYDPNGTTPFISDIYYKQNGAKLGDTGQDIIEYDGEIYVSVYGDNYLARLNAAGVEEKRVSFVNDPDLAKIRYIAAEDGYIYASFYYGAVAKINSRTLEVEKKLTGLGECLEAVVIEDGLLYVTNTCAADYTPYNEIKVIDLNTFTYKETITTLVSNPYNQMVAEEGKVFFISNVYTAPGSVLQMIDPKNGNKVTELGNASHLATYKDVVYVVNSFTDWGTYTTTTTFYTYDAKAGKLNSSSFLKNPPSELASTSIYMLEINPGNGDIYLAVSDYNSNGTIYRFKNDGTFVEKFDAGGMNPNGMVFFN